MEPGTSRAERLIAHLRDCCAACDHVPTPEEIVAAEMLLAERPQAVQRTLFNPQHANSGVAARGQPDPAGCVSALSRSPE
ncbi:MAG: hypothetical protein GAK28_03203 [Luteibacter sp.]|nr:MAG: hypothetical protein GAK28_03203 [Luteibacter sp.]